MGHIATARKAADGYVEPVELAFSIVGIGVLAFA